MSAQPAFAANAVRVNSTSLHSQTMPDIAIRGDYVVAVWQSDANYRWEIYAAVSQTGGETFGREILIAGGESQNHQAPSVAISPEGRACVAWHGITDDLDYDILMSCTGSPGGDFSAPVRINRVKQGNQLFPSIAFAPDGTLHAAWHDNRSNPSDYSIYTARSAGGADFEDGLKLSESAGLNLWASLAVSERMVAVAWQGPAEGGSDIFAALSEDGGTSFSKPASPPKRNKKNRDMPAVGISDGIVQLTWAEQRALKPPPDDTLRRFSNSDFDINFSFAKNNMEFSEPVRVNDERDGHQLRPDMIALPGAETAVAWFDGRSIADFDIYLSLGRRGKFMPSLRVNATEHSNSRNVRLSSDGGALVIIWQDDAEGNYEIYSLRAPIGSLR